MRIEAISSILTYLSFIMGLTVAFMAIGVGFRGDFPFDYSLGVVGFGLPVTILIATSSSVTALVARAKGRRGARLHLVLSIIVLIAAVAGFIVFATTYLPTGQIGS